MDERTLNNFLEKFSKNQHTEQEHQLFIKWLETAPIAQVEAVLEQYGQFFEALNNNEPVKYPELIDKIEAKLDALDYEENLHNTKLRFSLKRIIAIASIILLFIVAGVQFYKKAVRPQIAKSNVRFNPIQPGGNKAVLTLANGSKIILDGAKNGVLANQGNTSVDKTRDGTLVYDASKISAGTIGAQSAYNTIATPCGGQYQVVLPDGSKVWLNSASSLKFPVAFSGKERNVELIGEAYFEVAKNKAKPFKVVVNNSVVEVLGTHFNIMAYKDEKTTNTTLLEGSVKVTSGNEHKLIVPGEQARVNGNIQIAKVDAAQAIEWKNGNFNFSHEDIESIMRKVSRWYNVSVEYQGALTHEGFVGTVPRSENISEVLNTLELTGLVHFKMMERRIIVMP